MSYLAGPEGDRFNLPKVESRCVVDRSRVDLTADVRLLRGQRALTSAVQLEDANVTLVDPSGRSSGSETLRVETRPEDVTGVVPFSVTGGRLTVYAIECNRPALTARALVGLSPLGHSSNARVIGELGGYLQPTGIAATALDILGKKTPLQAVGNPVMLGGVIHPNPSVSAELAVPVAVRVQPSFTGRLVLDDLPGMPFMSARVVHPTFRRQVQATLSIGV